MEDNWKEFRDSGLLWWINMILHTFGWAIVVDIKDKSFIAYPKRVKYRGFAEDIKVCNKHMDLLIKTIEVKKNWF